MQSDDITSSTGLSAEDLELFAYLLEEEGVHTNNQGLIPRRDPNAEIPLSLAQERMWFLDQWDPGNPASNIPFAVQLKGLLLIPELQQSLNEIVRRHEALRTTFRVVNGQPQQIVAPSLIVPLPLTDLSHLPRSSHAPEVQRLTLEHAQHRFDLANGPLLRAELVRLADQEHVFLLNIHHAVFDAWSVGLFMRELTVLYDAFVNDQPSPLPDLPIQYPDFAIWQREWLSGEVLQQQLAYWKQQLGGSLPVLELPSDHPRPRMLTYQGAFGYHQLPAALSQQLNALSHAEGTTLFMTLFAAFQTLLYRYTGEEDIITGSAIANRDFVDIERLMGFFLNTLLLRTDLSGNPTFREFLQRTRELTLEAYAHQNVPFEQLVEELRPPRDTSHTPLFQVMFILQNAPVPAQGQRDLEVEYLRVDNGTSKFDLTLSLTEAPDGLRAVAEYKTDLFEAATIQRLLGHFQTLLEGIVADIDQPISKLPLLTAAEAQQLQTWNTSTIFPVHQCLHHLVEAQAQRTPAAIAAMFAGESLTYHDLSRRSNQLAHHLRALGVSPGDLVGITMERSLDLVVGLLGVLKAGAAYVPLDPTYPPDRLQFMVADAQPRVLLTDDPNAVSWQPPGWTGHLCTLAAASADPTLPDTPLDDASAPDDLAYVIYTSGSTGRPKGVAIPHRAVVNFLQAMRIRPGLSVQDTLLAVTTIAFDIAVLELFLPLTVGARIALVSREVASDGAQLTAALEASGATVMQATPATWHMLLAAGWEGSPSLRVLCGGEALPRELATRLHERCATLWNLYGPTETTIWSTVLLVEPGEAPVPIGGPIANTQLYILDEQLQPTPVGVPGELYIGGMGLARGYLNRPDLTAEKFIANPFGDATAFSDRLYRTGDRVQWRPDGTITFLGRADFQVKLRGFRIELGEIEAVLLEQTTVGEAVVIVRADATGDQQLVGYVVLTGTDGSGNGEALGHQDAAASRQAVVAVLREQLANRLPPYMLPQAVVVLEALPRTPNGKIDRKALPAPEQSAPTSARTLVLPRTPLETVLAGLWSEVLGRELIGVEDDFFELGGHSLKATQLLTRIRETFHVNLALRNMFQATTVATLAQLVVASETQPGKVEKIAQVLLHIHSISSEDRDRLLEQKRKYRGGR